MSFQVVILLGNLTRDAEVRQIGQNTVAVFGISTSHRFTKNGEPTTETEFHDIELWNNQGVYPYLKKGASVLVRGEIKTDRWTDQGGQQRERKKIRADILQLAGSRPQQAAPAPQYPQYPAQPQGYPQGYPGAPQPGYQQPYGAVAQPQMPPHQVPPQAPPMPQGAPFPPQQQAAPMPPATPPGQPSMAQQLDPNNYSDDLPF